jgi:hypothetical protein
MRVSTKQPPAATTLSRRRLGCWLAHHEAGAQALLQHHAGEHEAATRGHHAEQAQVGAPLQPRHVRAHVRAGCQLFIQ